MLARIAHQLRRRIETHRLAVQQRCQECVRVVPLEPGADIHQQRKTRRMAFRKTIFAKAFDLLEDALGKFQRIALLDHPPDQPLIKWTQTTLALPRGHCPAQAVGLARGKVGCQYRQLHHLLLEYRHTQGAR